MISWIIKIGIGDVWFLRNCFFGVGSYRNENNACFDVAIGLWL
jgi:hypothetical protein